MNIAITGASGFIGRRLAAAHIARGDRVRALSRGDPARLPAGVEPVAGDLLGSVPGHFLDQAEVLYHCAGELHNPRAVDAVNVEGTSRLLRAAQGRIGRWVQLSSIGVHGRIRSGTVTEETVCVPQNPYEQSKLRSDALVAEHAKAGGFSYCILRPSIVFGAGMPNQSLRQLAWRIRQGSFSFIGAPGASANYVHVSGVVEALLRCGSAQAAAGRTYNLSDHASIEQFVSTMAMEIGVAAPSLRVPEWLARGAAGLFCFIPRFPLTQGRIDALTGRAIYSIDRIRTELGYAHPVSIHQGMAEMAAEWKELWESSALSPPSN